MQLGPRAKQDALGLDEDDYQDWTSEDDDEGSHSEVSCKRTRGQLLSG